MCARVIAHYSYLHKHEHFPAVVCPSLSGGPSLLLES